MLIKIYVNFLTSVAIFQLSGVTAINNCNVHIIAYSIPFWVFLLPVQLYQCCFTAAKDVVTNVVLKWCGTLIIPLSH